MQSFLSPLLRPGGASLALTNTRHHRVVARTILTAFDSKSRRTGLLEHDSLPEGSALIIVPSQAIHTFSMRFSIDVAFVSKDGVVLKVRQAVPPRRIAVSLRTFAMMDAGRCAQGQRRGARGQTAGWGHVRPVSTAPARPDSTSARTTFTTSMRGAMGLRDAELIDSVAIQAGAHSQRTLDPKRAGHREERSQSCVSRSGIRGVLGEDPSKGIPAPTATRSPRDRYMHPPNTRRRFWRPTRSITG